MKSFSSAPSSPQQTRDLDLSRPCTKPLVILSPLVNKTPSSLNSSSGGGILTLLWLRTITWHLEGVILMLHGWPRTTPVTVEDCGLMKPAEPSHLQQHNTKATKPNALNTSAAWRYSVHEGDAQNLRQDRFGQIQHSLEANLIYFQQCGQNLSWRRSLWPHLPHPSFWPHLPKASLTAGVHQQVWVLQ